MHHFFQGFIPTQQVQIDDRTPQQNHNEMVLEIINNWDCVIDLVDGIKSGKIDQITVYEKDWLNFINSNALSIENFKTKDDFMNKNIKSLVDEK